MLKAISLSFCGTITPKAALEILVKLKMEEKDKIRKRELPQCYTLRDIPYHSKILVSKYYIIIFI